MQIQTADIAATVKEYLTVVLILAIGLASVVGLCWGLIYGASLILEHTTSTQMLFMCLVGFGLIHVARRYLQRGKK